MAEPSAARCTVALLVRKGDGTQVVAALVPEGSPVLSNDDVELVPGPGFPRV